MDWKIDKGAAACLACGRGFSPGEEFFSGLEETGAEEEFARRDFCPACWAKGPRPFFSHWRTKRPAGQGEVTFVERASLEECFRSLWESGEGAKRPKLLYVLALLLVRRKVFRLEEVEREGLGLRLKLKRVGSTERFTVDDPRLGLTEVDALLGEVGGLFAGPGSGR